MLYRILGFALLQGVGCDGQITSKEMYQKSINKIVFDEIHFEKEFVQPIEELTNLFMISLVCETNFFFMNNQEVATCFVRIINADDSMVVYVSEKEIINKQHLPEGDIEEITINPEKFYFSHNDKTTVFKMKRKLNDIFFVRNRMMVLTDEKDICMQCQLEHKTYHIEFNIKEDDHSKLMDKKYFDPWLFFENHSMFKMLRIQEIFFVYALFPN